MIKYIGPKKVIFGSDSSVEDIYIPGDFDSQRFHLNKYREIFSDQQMDLILNGHTKNLINHADKSSNNK